MDDDSFSVKTPVNYYPWFIMLIAIATVIVVNSSEGHVWWCKMGDITPWAWDIWSPHDSQHLIDPYSFTHVLHGVLGFWLIGLLFFRRLPFSWQLCVMVVFESSWEIAENSAYIINRYRAETISLDYFGDSIANSLSDIFFCALGFWVANKLGLWRSLIFFIVTEVVLIYWIHDSLLINIIMLIWPIHAIKEWQLAVS